MLSKARFVRASIHPMLVGFPIAFYTATLAALIAYLANGETYWYRTALLANVIGVACALVAMIPGIIDLFGLPPHSAARRLGVEHGSARLFATGLFGASAFVLGREWSARSPIEARYTLDAMLPVVFVAIGFLTMIIGSALGRSFVEGNRRIDALARPAATPTLQGEVARPPDEGENEADGVDFLNDVPTRPISAPRHDVVH